MEKGSGKRVFWTENRQFAIGQILLVERFPTVEFDQIANANQLRIAWLLMSIFLCSNKVWLQNKLCSSLPVQCRRRIATVRYFGAIRVETRRLDRFRKRSLRRLFIKRSMFRRVSCLHKCSRNTFNIDFFFFGFSTSAALVFIWIE